jgi:hypothetical protein
VVLRGAGGLTTREPRFAALGGEARVSSANLRRYSMNEPRDSQGVVGVRGECVSERVMSVGLWVMGLRRNWCGGAVGG